MNELVVMYGWLKSKLTGLQLTPEKWGMGAVILVSTYHVIVHMAAVEGYWIVAALMGLVLGFLNGLFAYRLFENKIDKRAPAIVGLAFTALISFGMQLSFYSDKNLQGYEVAALSIWAPALEIILGWLYGVRMASEGKVNDAMETLRNQLMGIVESAQSKLAAQLSLAQDLRDQIFDRNAWIDQLQSEVKGLQAQVGDLRVQSAVARAQKRNATQPLRKEKPVQTIAHRNGEITELALEARRLKGEGKTIAQISGLIDKSPRTVNNYLAMTNGKEHA